MNEVDAFIAAQPADVRERLQDIRAAIQHVIPESSETISYGIPTFQVNSKNVVHYGPGKNHIGFYAAPSGHIEFEAELSKYKRGKGSVQFSLDRPLPIDLIQRMALFRATQVKKGER